MGKRNRESTCFYYETPFPNYAPSRRHNKNRWWKNTTCSYHYLWFTLSELIKYRKTRRSCRKSIQFILSCDTNYRRNERSEEHTSELQSRVHLVCRLLLGIKKI